MELWINHVRINRARPVLLSLALIACQSIFSCVPNTLESLKKLQNLIVISTDIIFSHNIILIFAEPTSLQCLKWQSSMSQCERMWKELVRPFWQSIAMAVSHGKTALGGICDHSAKAPPSNPPLDYLCYTIVTTSIKLINSVWI